MKRKKEHFYISIIASAICAVLIAGCRGGFIEPAAGANGNGRPQSAASDSGAAFGAEWIVKQQERQDEERDNVTGFSWLDFENGGFLMLNAHPTKGISFNFTSGCRPSTSKNAYPPPLKGVPTVPFTPQQETPSPSAMSPST